MRMKRKNYIYLLTTTLTLITLVIVGVTQSMNVITLDNYPELVMYGLLTAFALYFSVQTSNGELSMAHVVGMMAFLAYPASASGLILLVIFVGGLSGGFLMVLRAFLQPPSQRRVRANLNTLVYVTARVTASYFVANTLYKQMSAPLPLNEAISLPQLADTFSAVITYAVVYIAIYTAIFALQLYAEGHNIEKTFRDNFALILVILVGTVPFAILAAVSPSASSSIVSFAIVVAGTMFSVFGLHAISRVTLRMQKQLDEVQALSRISQALTGNLNLQSLYSALYEQIQSLMNIRYFKVVLYKEDTHHYNYVYVVIDGKPEAHDIFYIPDDLQLIQRVMVTRQPVHIQDNVQNNALTLGLSAPAKLTSWLGVPLLSGNTIIGALIVSEVDDKHHFEDTDKSLLSIIAGTASVAIENTRLYEQQSQRAEQLTTLNKVATLLSGTLLRDDVVDIIISSASTITEGHAVAFYLTSAGRKNRLQFVKSAGLSDTFANNPPLPQLTEQFENISIDSKIIKPYIIENIEHIPRTVPMRSHMITEGMGAWVELPLQLNNNNHGIICIFYNEAQSFAAEQITLMEAYATQASQAVNNALMYAVTDEALEIRIEQLYALAAMGRLLNATTDSVKICDVVLNYAGDATKADRGFTVLFNPDHSTIHVCAEREYDNSLITIDNLTQGLNAHVLETHQAIRSDDIRFESGYLPIIPNTRSLLIVPLIRGKEFLGLIRLESENVRAFTDGDLHFVSQIANQAITAIDNTLLFQRIRTTRDSLQTILDGMEDGIIMINAEKVVTIANPPIAMLGVQPEAIIGKHIDVLLNDPELHFVSRLGFEDVNALTQVLDHLNHQRYWRNHLVHEYSTTEADNTRIFIKRLLIPVNNDDDRVASGVLMVFYDKTEEHKLAQVRDSLSQMIVHDLRSPLTAVTTSLTLLRTISIEDDKLKPIIEKTTSASQQAIQQVLSRINSLLDVSKMESGLIEINQEPSELTTVVDNVLISLSPLAHEMNVTLKNNIPDTLPLLLIDRDKIERVLQNLVDNALKYSDKDGQVIVGVAQSTKNNIRIDIVDEGPGIPDQYKTTVFNRYAQIEGRNSIRGGVGLGLTFCRMVTEAHGGKIWVEDNPAGGSIFSLTLPTATDQIRST